MHWLNYHHLLYFWTVVREGSITQTAKKLFVSQSTVSGQLRELEKAVGKKLYETSGRKLALTATGRLVFEYAEEIFSTGQELMDRLKGGSGHRALPFVVGVPDVMPKLIASRILEPVLLLPERVRLICREAKLSELLVDLALHRLDIVLSDSQVGSQNEVRVFHHPLGESEIEWVATVELREKYAAGFPKSLIGAPLILPTEGTVLRRMVEQWMIEKKMEANIVAEIEDSALMKSLAARGLGIVPIPSAVADDALRQYGLHSIGRLNDARLHFYAISIEKKVTHPAVLAIAETASRVLLTNR